MINTEKSYKKTGVKKVYIVSAGKLPDF